MIWKSDSKPGDCRWSFQFSSWGQFSNWREVQTSNNIVSTLRQMYSKMHLPPQEIKTFISYYKSSNVCLSVCLFVPYLLRGPLTDLRQTWWVYVGGPRNCPWGVLFWKGQRVDGSTGQRVNGSLIWQQTTPRWAVWDHTTAKSTRRLLLAGRVIFPSIIKSEQRRSRANN